MSFNPKEGSRIAMHTNVAHIVVCINTAFEMSNRKLDVMSFKDGSVSPASAKHATKRESLNAKITNPPLAEIFLGRRAVPPPEAPEPSIWLR